MKPLKTISLTLTELQSLMGIDSPAERQQAIDYVTAAMENPEQVDPETVTGEHPALRAFARRVHRRVVSARKRSDAAARRVKNVPAAVVEAAPQSASDDPATAPAELLLPPSQAARYRKILKHAIQLIRALNDIAHRADTVDPHTPAYLSHLQATLSRHLRTVRSATPLVPRPGGRASHPSRPHLLYV